MARTETKKCGKCGKPFESPLDKHGMSNSTVNCPDCRGREKRVAFTPNREVSGKYNRGYDDQKEGRARIATSNGAYNSGWKDAEAGKERAKF